MPRPLIAVIGSATKTTDPDLARRAGEQLGSELAKRNCRILVFSSSNAFIEWEAVQGYLSTDTKKEPRCIEVRYPPDLHGRFPGEQPNDPLFVRRQQSGDWEASIYPSFATIDGLILVGGAYTTKIAGLLAMGSRTPVITLAGFGGSAQQVWVYLKGDRDNSFLTEDDLSLMANPDWSSDSAARLVDSLLDQIQRRAELARQAALGESERIRRRRLSGLALLGSGLFLMVLFALTLLPALSHLPPWFRCLLVGTPALAGASGAAIRVLWDNWSQSAVPMDLRPIGMTITLGFWASGVVSALFLLEQLWVLGTLKPDDAGKLFGVGIGIGLLAGLTLNKVFPKLIQYEAPLETDFTKKSNRSRPKG